MLIKFNYITNAHTHSRVPRAESFETEPLSNGRPKKDPNVSKKDILNWVFAKPSNVVKIKKELNG